jgi:N-acyl-D-aspartate/D-glutamate deacylase
LIAGEKLVVRIALSLCLFAFLPAQAQEAFDLVVANGTMIDGSGAEGRRADVGVRAGKIAAIGDLSKATRTRTVDASGLMVAPGFIDMHNHSDTSLLSEPRCESMIRQGVTTMVLGEGGSAGPVRPGRSQPWTTLGGYFDHVEKKGVAANIASYVGQTQVWTYVKGFDLKPATSAEVEAMKAEVDKAMREGAMGLSTSLLMPPSNLVTTAQLIELAKVASKSGGISSTHTRDEGQGVFRSVEESINIGKGAKIRVDLIHLKIADKKLWGQMNEVVSMINKARAEGHDIRAHVYPYHAGQNNLRAIIPPWAHDGGNEKMLERLRNPELRARMKKDILNGLPNWYNHYLAIGSWEGMLLVSMEHEKNKPFVGKRMSELIKARGGDPVEVLFDVLLEENGSVGTVYFHHTEEDMQYAMKQPFTSIGSDGSAMSPEGSRGKSNPHPRSYGTFPRVLGRYVRELKVLTLPEAVKKMTSMNADKISIKDRGLLKEGYWADIAIFDPTTVADRATYVNPHQYAVGIPYVIVNGQVVLDNGKHTGVLPGKVVRGPGYLKKT